MTLGEAKRSVPWKYLGLTAAAIGLLIAFRFTALNGYLIVDEPDRWHWAESFYRALIAGDWRATLVGDGYPGIVPAWVETLWLLAESVRRSIVEGRWFSPESVYMLFHEWGRNANLALQRMPMVIFNTGLALLVGWQAARIYGRRVGVVALMLVALDPFYLADARLNRAEAVITGLLTLCVLLLVRYGQTRRPGWLIASGVLGGLGFLTKIQGLVVLPAIGLILLYLQLSGPTGGAAKRPGIGCWLGAAVRAGLVWALAAGVTWVALWPTMWVRPLDTLALVFDYATRKAGSEGVNLFFMGQLYYDENPGWLFYPVVAVLRMTPLTMIGLVLAGWGGLRSLRARMPFSPTFAYRAIVPVLLFVLLYGAAMSFGSHKQDRYLMPIFLCLDMLAAMGWLYAWDQLRARWGAFGASRWPWLVAAGLLAAQLATVLPSYPYYLPYFNPLLGGEWTGPRILRVGWGEGMDQVAGYLNQLPDARNLTVAARWYQYLLGFSGKKLPFDESGQWTQADYMVLYIQQTQRMLDPSPGVIRYLQGRTPEHVIMINGIDYAQVYRSPFTRPADPLVSLLPNRAALLGYRWEEAAPEPSGAAGIQPIRVIWENRGVTQPPVLAAALTDGDSSPAWQSCSAAPGFETAAVTPGEVVESVCNLEPAADRLPPGSFDLRVGLADATGRQQAFVFPQGWRALVKQADGRWRPAQRLEAPDAIARGQQAPQSQAVEVIYRGQVRLVGYQLDATGLHPGQSFELTLYWQALAPLQEDYRVFAHVFGLDGAALGSAEEAPPLPTNRWLPGQVVSTTHQLRVPADAPAPAVATLDVGLYDAQRRSLAASDRSGRPKPLTITRLKLVPASWSPESPPVKDGVWFGDEVLLQGHTPLAASYAPGNRLELRLWWQISAPLSVDYSIFVHLVDPQGAIAAQADGVPLAGRYPTGAWEVGEPIIDTRSLTLPASLAPGDYQLRVGVYDPLDGSRLQPANAASDSVLLGQLKIVP